MKEINKQTEKWTWQTNLSVNSLFQISKPRRRKFHKWFDKTPPSPSNPEWIDVVNSMSVPRKILPTNQQRYFVCLLGLKVRQRSCGVTPTIEQFSHKFNSPIKYLGVFPCRNEWAWLGAEKSGCRVRLWA